MAYVYYSPDGDIRHITYNIDKNAELSFDKIEISEQTFVDFMSGKENHDLYFVKNIKHIPTLILKENYTEILYFIDDDYVILGEEKLEGMALRISVASLGSSIKFHIDHLKQKVEFEAKELEFFIYDKNDPTILYDKIMVDTELLLKNDFVYTLKHYPEHISIMCRRVIPTYVEVVQYQKYMLKLPSNHRFDWIKFEQIIENPSLIASVDNKTKNITFYTTPDAKYYIRDSEKMLIIYTPPDDPSIILHTDSIELAPLYEKETIQITFPKWLDNYEFDIFGQLCFDGMKILYSN